MRGGNGPDAARVSVFYDGACPLCRREIGFYRRCEGSEAVEFVDISKGAGGEAAPGLSRDEAMRRFHVRGADGKIVSGGMAFVELWKALPGFRQLGRLLSLWPFPVLLEGAYRAFLVLRPALQRLARD
ncbi:DUF393 domain-containing protein [Rhizobiales bacterium]|nr:DUF393 domain-containing protein [Hongsoonwoonella zoysiae]